MTLLRLKRKLNDNITNKEGKTVSYKRTAKGSVSKQRMAVIQLLIVLWDSTNEKKTHPKSLFTVVEYLTYSHHVHIESNNFYNNNETNSSYLGHGYLVIAFVVIQYLVSFSMTIGYLC